MTFDRRTLVKGTAGAALLGGATLEAWGVDDLDGADLGVASGDPWPDGFVIWTRLPRGKRDADAVTWEVATDEAFAAVVARGEVKASAAHDWCVKARVRGLEPFSTYFYRFTTEGGFASAIGRAKTAPAAGTMPEALKIAVMNCQQYTNGYFSVYAHIGREDPDVCLHLGDHIYEKESGKVRGGDPLGGRVALTLEDYRRKWRLYLSDPQYREARRRHAFIEMWDDHEVFNNYSRVARGEDAARFSAAYQTFLDYLPVEGELMMGSDGPEVTLSRRLGFGDLVDIFVTDQRQFRDDGPCSINVFTSGCAARLGRGRTMLGAAQKSWLKDGLAGSRAVWKLLLSEVMITPLRLLGGRRAAEALFHGKRVAEDKGGTFMTLDTWDGFPAERQELVSFLRAEGVRNVTILTGDIHAAVTARIPVDVEANAGPQVALEIVTTSITSKTVQEHLGSILGSAAASAVRGANPQYDWFDIERHGYTVLTVDARRLVVRYMALESIEVPDAEAFVAREIVVPAT